MYRNFAELESVCAAQKIPLWQGILENEKKLTDAAEEEIFAGLDAHYAVMLSSATRALETPLPTALGLITGITAPQYRYAQREGSLCGNRINRAMAYALSSSEANAAMGKICAAPTAGACGILPAVLLTLAEDFSLPPERIREGLLLASGIGAIIMHNATVSGAEGGCQAECGVAAAMAAGAAVELMGGGSTEILHAISFSLMNCMGLVCDPVAGLVQIPCAQRNASQTVNALLSADLALAGMPCILSADEVVEAMYRVGKQLPMQLRETALGGVAASPTAKELFHRLHDTK